MKRIITLLALSLTFVLAGANGKQEWRERLMSVKIAFLTLEMELTPEEAGVLWPVYSSISKERDAAMYETFQAFRSLEEAVSNNCSDKEVSKLLDAYNAAQEKQRAIDKMADSELRKVLDVNKLAKLYIAEEKFRRQNIRKLRGGHGTHQPDNEEPER